MKQAKKFTYIFVVLYVNIVGIEAVTVSLIAQKTEVKYQVAVVTPAEIALMIEDMGFDAEVKEEQKAGEETLNLIVSKSSSNNKVINSPWGYFTQIIS